MGSQALMRRPRSTNSAMELQIVERRCASRAQPRQTAAATSRTDAQPPTWIHMLSLANCSRQHASIELCAAEMAVERSERKLCAGRMAPRALSSHFLVCAEYLPAMPTGSGDLLTR